MTAVFCSCDPITLKFYIFYLYVPSTTPLHTPLCIIYNVSYTTTYNTDRMKRWIAIYNTICIFLRIMSVSVSPCSVATSSNISFWKDACAILLLTNVCSQPNLILFNVCYSRLDLNKMWKTFPYTIHSHTHTKNTGWKCFPFYTTPVHGAVCN